MAIEKSFVVTRSGNKVTSLNKKQEKILAFIGSSYKEGDSVPMKKLVRDFSAWSEKTGTVLDTKLVQATDIRKVCEYYALSDMSQGATCLPMLVFNNGIGTLQFLAREKAMSYISAKNREEKVKKEFNLFEFVSKYVDAHEDFDIEAFKLAVANM